MAGKFRILCHKLQGSSAYYATMAGKCRILWHKWPGSAAYYATNDREVPHIRPEMLVLVVQAKAKYDKK
jgi:hypothetical protein